jgi:hypothetical protein
MVIVNGTISAKLKQGGGLDAAGYPLDVTASWAPPVPCRVSVNSKSNIGKQNGNTFTTASYTVLIEYQPFEAERVKLTEHGRDLGEFPVMYTEYLDVVGKLKIVV